MDSSEKEKSGKAKPSKDDKGEDDKDNLVEDGDDEEEEEDDGFQFKWLDNGRRRDGRREYETVLLTLHGTSFRVTRNDFVLLWGDHVDDKTDDDMMNQTIEEIWQAAGCAKVEAMWEDRSSNSGQPRAMFQARWFFQKSELDRMVDAEDVTGSISLDALKKRLRPREVVGSEEVGDYSMNTIGGPARVFFRTANEDNFEEVPELPKDAFLCRYSLVKKVVESEGAAGSGDDKEAEKTVMEVVPYTADSASEDEDDDEEDEKESRKRRRDSDKDRETVDEDDSSDNDRSSSDEESRQAEAEGEGSITNQGKIRVGPQHQVPVPPYDPNTKIVSRNPTLVWSPSKMPTQELDDYFRKVGAILTPFAEQQLLIMGTEPFTSIPADRMESLMRTRETNAPLTVSSISTSASLASPSPQNTLLRESDSDALLKNLHDQKYNVDAAVAMVAANPREFLANWTITEREGFDVAFRKEAGSLRMVAKSLKTLSTNKTHSEVVDYHYRFKIPDQFRRYQDKKREQAVRMMECIEARKFNDNSEVHVLPQTNYASGDRNYVGDDTKRRKVGNWSETGTSDVASAVEERRSAAKQLLLDIQRDLGKDKMAEVAGAIISLNKGSERDSKEALLRILKNQPQLHQRLVEFLPRRFSSFHY